MVQRKHKLQLKIVLDANAIWTGSESFLLGREIAELVNSHRGDAHLSIEWILPEVVLGERVYQMQREALNLLPSLAKLERVIGHGLNITEELISRKISESVNQQVQDHQLEVHAAAYDRVDWSRLVGDSINRRPPFEKSIADNKRNTEKGFRDAIIAETFLQVVEGSPEQAQRCRIVLLTKDGLLTEAIRSRISHRSNVQVLSTADELKNLINTLISTVPEEYVARLQKRAKDYFIKDGETQTGLFYDLKVRATIEKNMATELDSRPERTDRRENGQWQLTSLTFRRKEGQRVFWTAKISIPAKAYIKNQLQPSYSDALSSYAKTMQWDPEKYPYAPVVTPFDVGKFESPGMVNVNAITSPIAPLKYTSTYTGKLEPEPYLKLNLLAGDERLVYKGKTVVDVNWSVSVSVKGALSKPKLDSVDFIETVWEPA